MAKLSTETSKSAKPEKPSKNSSLRSLVGDDGHKDTKKVEALKRLGLKKGDMDGVPKVSDRIVDGAGGIKTAIDALRGDDSEDAQAFIEKYDGISDSDRERLTLEEIFTAAGLSARRFVEVVTGALMQQSADTTKMMIAVSQPKVMASTVKAATESLPILGSDGEVVGWTNGDVKAMEIFHKITGAMPTPKGNVVTFNQQNNTVSSEGRGDVGPPASMDEYLIEMQDVVRPKALSASVEPVVHGTVPEYLDVEV